MKKVLWLVIILAVLILGLPGLIGSIAESKAYEQIELVKDNPAFTLKISNYDRGWFSSDVTYEYGLKDDYIDLLERSGSNPQGSDTTTHEGPDHSQSSSDDSKSWRDVAAPLEMLGTITHGPIGLHDGLFFGLFKADITNGPDNPRLNQFLQATGMPHLFQSQIATGFTGNTEFSATIPAVNANATTLPAGNGLRSVEFTGLTLSGDYAAGAQHLVSEGSSERLNIVADDLSMTMQGLAFDTDTSIKVPALPFGTISFAVDQMRVFDANSSQAGLFELSNLTFNADTTQGGSTDTANVVASYKIAQVTAAENVLTDLEMTMQMDNLSIAATERYTQWSQEFGTADQNNPELIQQMVKDFTPIAHQFMAVSPSLTISPLKFTANQEPFESEIKLNIDGSKLPPADEFDVTNIPVWLAVLTGEANASISEPLATTMAVSSARSQLLEVLEGQDGITLEQINEMAINQAPIVIETLVGQGMIQRSDGKLGAQVSYGNGALLLNGQPMPLDALMGGAPSL